MEKNNYVVLNGRLAGKVIYSHTVGGSCFYTANIMTYRLSGVSDIIPILIKDDYMDIFDQQNHQLLCIKGEMRSHTIPASNKLFLFVLVKSVKINFFEDFEQDNYICLEGFLCKEPKFRITPFGRKITDLFLAINHGNGKSSYIPCICWGREALNARELPVGLKINIAGRIQSREYNKIINESISEKRMAIEVSINNFKVN